MSSDLGCLPNSSKGNRKLEKIGDTVVDLNKCKNPELFQYMKKFNRVIPREFLKTLGMVVEEHEIEEPIDPRIEAMTAEFAETCVMGYRVDNVVPYMSTEYPYCRWVVHYRGMKRDEVLEDRRVDGYLLSLSKPRSVYSIMTPKQNMETGSVKGPRWMIMFGVKECSCPKPTPDFARQYNLKNKEGLKRRY